MGVSKNDGIPKIIHSRRVFHYKPSILGYPYFWKHPYGLKCGYHFQHRKIAQRVLVGPLVDPGEFLGTIEFFQDIYFVVEIGNCWRSTTVLPANQKKIISMFKKSDTWSKRATFCFVLFCLFVFGLQLKVRYSPNRIHRVTGKFTNTDRSKVFFWFAWILNGFSMSFCRGWKETHLPWFSGRHCKWRGTTRWAASWGCCCSRSDENCSDNLGGGYFHCQSPKFTRDRHPQSNKLLGGGVKYFFIFTPKIGEMVQLDEHIFQMGWKHQLVIVFMGVELSL